MALREVFDYYDADRSGLLDINQTFCSLVELGLETTIDDLAARHARFGVDTNVCGFEDFCRVVQSFEAEKIYGSEAPQILKTEASLGDTPDIILSTGQASSSASDDEEGSSGQANSSGDEEGSTGQASSSASSDEEGRPGQAHDRRSSRSLKDNRTLQRAKERQNDKKKEEDIPTGACSEGELEENADDSQSPKIASSNRGRGNHRGDDHSEFSDENDGADSDDGETKLSGDDDRYEAAIEMLVAHRDSTLTAHNAGRGKNEHISLGVNSLEAPPTDSKCCLKKADQRTALTVVILITSASSALVSLVVSHHVPNPALVIACFNFFMFAIIIISGMCVYYGHGGCRRRFSKAQHTALAAVSLLAITSTSLVVLVAVHHVSQPLPLVIGYSSAMMAGWTMSVLLIICCGDRGTGLRCPY